MSEKSAFTLHLWNKKYGNDARFVVENNADGKFCEYSPTRPKDIAWIDKDLTHNPDYSDWEDFQKEQVDDITDIIM